MMNLVILFAALFSRSVVSESNCQELRRSVNGEKFPYGCPGAVMSNGAPARAYCINSNGRMPWYKDCCIWQANKCVPKPTPKPTAEPTSPPTPINCQVLRRSVNGDKFPKGCPGAVMSNGAPARAYCVNSNGRMPWYSTCCIWQANKCVPKPTPKPVPAPTPAPVATPAAGGCEKKVRLTEKECTRAGIASFAGFLHITPCEKSDHNDGVGHQETWNAFPAKLQIQGAPAGIMLDYNKHVWIDRETRSFSCLVADTPMCQGIYKCEGAVPKEPEPVDCKAIVKKKQCKDGNNGCSWSNGVCRGEDDEAEAGSCAAIKGRKKCKKNKACVYRFRRCTEVSLEGCGQYLKFKHCKKQEACHWEKNTCAEGAGAAKKACSQLKKRGQCAARADCEFADGKCSSTGGP